jgi:hypothetical protein
MSEPAVQVLDTYLRALRKLAGLARDVSALEADVAGREADALREILRQVEPLLPVLVRPVSIKEPWLALGAADVTWREPAVLLVESFQQDQGLKGRVTRTGRLLLLIEGGRLVEVELRGAWTEGPGGAVTDSTWRVDGREREVTPELARTNLRPILSGLLVALKDALVKGRAERASLTLRLELLGEVDQLLRRRKTGAVARPGPARQAEAEGDPVGSASEPPNVSDSQLDD